MKSVNKNGTQTPWLREHQAQSAADLLNYEANDLYDYLRPATGEQNARSDIVKQLNDILQKHYPLFKLSCFGSYAARLYLPDSDIDLTMTPTTEQYPSSIYGDSTAIKRYKHVQMATQVANLLRVSDIAVPGSVTAVTGASVPLAKFVHKVTGIEVDLSFDNQRGLAALEHVKVWCKTYPDLVPLVLIIKLFLALNSHNVAVHGGLGGLSVIGMVACLLHHDHSVKPGCKGNLGELLLKFFRFYGSEFDYMNLGIVTNPMRFTPKTSLPRYDRRDGFKFVITDPIDGKWNVSSSAKNSPQIVAAFSQAYNAIIERQKQVERNIAKGIHSGPTLSILACVFRGDYSNWKSRAT